MSSLCKYLLLFYCVLNNWFIKLFILRKSEQDISYWVLLKFYEP